MYTCKQESSDGLVELKEEEELVAEALLTFLYTWDYADFFQNGGGASALALSQGSGHELVLARSLFHIKVVVAADKYGVPALQQQATDTFRRVLFDAASAAATHLRNGAGSASASQHRLTPATLTTILDEVYNGVAAALPDARQLRSIVCLVVSYGISELTGEPRFVALLERCVDLAADVAKSLAWRMEDGLKEYKCPKCFKSVNISRASTYSPGCWNCPHSADGKEWAKTLVLPDLAAKWKLQQEKRE